MNEVHQNVSNIQRSQDYGLNATHPKLTEPIELYGNESEKSLMHVYFLNVAKVVSDEKTPTPFLP